MAAQKWTRETISNVIKTCKSGKDFKRRYASAFQVMKTNGWEDLKELLPTHAPDYKKEHPPLKYTESVLADLIAKCDSRSTFKAIYPYAYISLKRRGLERMLSSLPMYSVSETEPPLWCVYRWTFLPSNAIYIGLTKDFKARVRAELSNATTSPVKSYLDDSGDRYIVEKVKSGLHSNDAAELERYYISQYRAEGRIVLNRHPGGSLGGYKTADLRSDEEILNEIFANYKSYKELRLHGKGLYAVVCQRNLYGRVHARLPKTSHVKYSKEYLEEVIAKCDKYDEFKLLYPLEYNYMKNKGICHMLNSLERTVAHRPVILPDGFDTVVDLVNRGEMTRQEAAARLNRSVNWLVKAGKGILRPGSEVRKRKPSRPAVDWEAKRTKRRSDLLAEVTNKYTTLSELRDDRALYARVKRNGIYNEVSALLVHKNRNAVTREDVLNAVAKCTSYAQFMKEYGSEYGIAKRNGWTDLLDTLPRRHKNIAEYTYEYLQECAKQCSSRTDFNKRFRSETYAAKKLGIYHDLVKDLPKQTGKR